MKKILVILLAGFILIGCGKKTDKKPEVKKYVCNHHFTNENDEDYIGYIYTVDYEGEHVIFIEENSWNLIGWEYNLKNYEKRMANEAEILNKIAGVTVSYTADSANKAYTIYKRLDMAELDSTTYFAKSDSTMFASPYIIDYLQAWVGSDDPDYHLEKLKEAFNSNKQIFCE